MIEEFVTFETAKLLKEKGFNWKCGHTTSCDNIIRRYDIPQSMSCCTEIDNGPVEFLCPVLYVAQKWLRETKDIHICIYNCACGYGYEISKADNGTHMASSVYKGTNDGEEWDSYEEALEAGLQEALKLI